MRRKRFSTKFDKITAIDTRLLKDCEFHCNITTKTVEKFIRPGD